MDRPRHLAAPAVQRGGHDRRAVGPAGHQHGDLGATAVRPRRAPGAPGRGEVAPRHTGAMDVLRTPDDRFASLPGFAHPPSYADVPDGEGGTLRMAYVDAGPADGPVALLLHGEPTWSFLYRDVIDVLVAPGSAPWCRTWSGSAAPTSRPRQVDHSYARHVEWVRALAFDVLDLRGVTLVGQDWGGLIGLRLVAEHLDRFAAVVAANTGLPTGDCRCPTSGGGSAAPSSAPSTSTSGGSSRPAARADARRGPGGVRRAVPGRQLHGRPAGDAHAGADLARRPGDSGEPRRLGDADARRPAVPGRVQRRRPDHRRDGAGAARSMPGAQGLDHPVVAGAGHFLQEDAGARLGEIVAAFVHRGPAPRRAILDRRRRAGRHSQHASDRVRGRRWRDAPSWRWPGRTTPGAWPTRC